MSYMGHPILGDSLYGSQSDIISRQALHAYEVIFNHPLTQKRLKITADIPDDINRLLTINMQNKFRSGGQRRPPLHMLVENEEFPTI